MAEHVAAGADPESAEWLASGDLIAQELVRWARSEHGLQIVRWWRQVEWALVRLGATEEPAWMARAAERAAPVTPTPAAAPTADPLAARIPPASGPDGGA